MHANLAISISISKFYYNSTILQLIIYSKQHVSRGVTEVHEVLE